MKHGIYAPPHNDYGDPKRLVDLAVESERAGFNAIFIWDHLFLGGEPDVTDATVVLGAIAHATKRIRLGAMVTPLARRRPWKLAKELTTLDQLSAGRITLGIGIGSHPELEFGNVGEDDKAKSRAERLDEGLLILDPLLRGETVQHTGKYYQVHDTKVSPACVQRPRLPIWAAASLPVQAGLRRAARWDGIFPISLPETATMREDGSFDTAQMWLDPEGFADCVKATLEYRAAIDSNASATEFAFAASGDTRCDSASEARAKVRAFETAGANWWLEWIDDRLGTYDETITHVRRGPAGRR